MDAAALRKITEDAILVEAAQALALYEKELLPPIKERAAKGYFDCRFSLGADHSEAVIKALLRRLGALDFHYACAKSGASTIITVSWEDY